SRITPASKFLTRATSIACCLALRFLCTLPMPPSWAMAMARRASVTVSIAAEMIGRFRRSEGVRRVARETSLGRTEECAGTSETSSYVSASAWMRSIGSPGSVGSGALYRAATCPRANAHTGTGRAAAGRVRDHPPSTPGPPECGPRALSGLPHASELPRQQPDRADQVRQARGHPHDQAGQLLVGQHV